MNRIRNIAVILILIGLSINSLAQNISINADGAAPDSSAMLDVSDTTRGFLMPRMNTIHMNSINDPAEGLLIFNTDSSSYYYYNGSNWTDLSATDTTTATVPIGTILSYGGDTSVIPNGFLLCNGGALDTGIYNPLFSVIGYSWGGANASFNLPDLRGRFLRGVDLGSGNDPDATSRLEIAPGGNTGDGVGSLQNDTLQAHSHDLQYRATTSPSAGVGLLSGLGINNSTSPANQAAQGISTSGGSESRPKNAAVNFIICFDSEIASQGGTSGVGSLTQNLSFVSPNLSISGGNSVDLSALTAGATPNLTAVIGAGNNAGADTIVNLNALSIGTSDPPVTSLRVDSFLLLQGKPYSGFRWYGFNTYYDGVSADPTYLHNGYADILGQGMGRLLLAHWGYNPAGSALPNNSLSQIDLQDSSITMEGEATDFQIRLRGNVTTDSLSINGIYAFPRTTPSNGQVLRYNGSRVEWGTNSAGSTIADTDDDTKIQVEESGDEDIIRFDIKGDEFFRMDSGRFEIVNTGNSVFLGDSSGYNDDYSANVNTLLGFAAGKTLTNGEENVYVGWRAGRDATGSYNVAMGGEALMNLGNRDQNTAVGDWAMRLSQGDLNTALGAEALYENTGNQNVAIGYLAFGNTSGGSGSRNVAIGPEAGSQNSGDDNVFIGSLAGSSIGNISNRLYIDNSGTATPLIYGDFAADSLRFNGVVETSSNLYVPLGNVGIGTNTPTAALTVSGSGDVKTDIFNYASSIFDKSAVNFLKARGTEGAELAVINDDKVGSLGSFAYDGSAYGQVGRIQFEIDGVPAVGDLPGRMLFFTSSAGSLVSTERMRIDSDGNVGIGTSIPTTNLTIAGTGEVSTRINSYATSLSENSSLNFSKARGSEGAEAAVVNNDVIGQIAAFAHDGTSYGVPSKIMFEMDGVPAAGDLPGRIQFHTTAAGSSTTTERMRINSNGDVGIGTANPSYKLDVNGEIRAESGIGFYSLAEWDHIKFEHTGSVAYMNVGGTADGLGFRTENTTTGYNPTYTEHMRIRNDGNIGIGTNIPALNLHIQDNVAGEMGQVTENENASGYSIFRMRNNLGAGGDLVMFHNGSSRLVDGGAGSSTLRNDGSGDMIITSSSADVVLQPSSGNVGIGTTAPAQLLHISSTTSGDANFMIEADTDNNNESDNPSIVFQQDGGAVTGRVGLTGLLGETYTNSLANAIHMGADGATDLQLYTNTVARITIDESGQVGVGTNSPQGNLSILDNGTATPGIFLEGYGNAEGDIAWNTGESFQIGDWNGSTFTERLRINTSGDVGIGTNSPIRKLDVVDNQASFPVLRVENENTGINADGLAIILGEGTPTATNNFVWLIGNAGGSTNGSITGNGSGGVTYNTTSDRRLKTNIKPMSNALRMISRMQPRVYNRILNPTTIEYGFIAQELQKVYPQAVSGTPDGDPKTNPMGVDYGQLTPVLVKAIQELNERIETLEKENLERLNRIEMLEEQLKK